MSATADDTTWVIVEDEDVAEEGFALVDANGDYGQYAMKSATKLFPTEESARSAIANLTAQGMPIGTFKVIPARLVHRRKLEVAETSPKLLIVP